MNKKFIFLISTILLISLVSAAEVTPLQEFMSSNEMTITITQDTTTNVFTMNTSKCSWDTQDVLLPNKVTIKGVSISGLLNGVNLRVDLLDGSNYPTFSNVQIQQNSITSLIFDNLLAYMNLTFTTADINEDNSIITNLVRDNLPEGTPSAEGNFHFTKSGTTYTLEYDEGFGVVSNEYKNEIGKIIAKGVNSMNIREVLENNLLPILNVEENFPILEEIEYEVNEEDIDFAHALLLQNTEYNVSVDLTTLKFQDGNYKIPVIITPLMGDKTPIQKEITLILSGIINQIKEQATVNGTYTPSDTGVKEVIKTITGLPSGTTINQIQIFDTKPIAVETLSHTTGLKYLVIEVNLQPIAGAEIRFTIDKSKVDDKDRISLYVWETSTSSWTKLTTTYLGETTTEYEYSATTPHFSTFMIGETAPSTSSSSGSHHRSQSNIVIEDNDNTISPSSEVGEPEEIKLETPKQEDNFFTRLGRFLTGRSVDGTQTGSNFPPAILMLTLMVVSLTVIVLAVRKRNKSIVLKTAKILKDNSIKKKE